MYHLSRRKPEEIDLKIIKCTEHEGLQRKLARIEGENIAILVMLAVIIAAILTGRV